MSAATKVARGFRAAGVESMIKKRGGLDIALIASDRPCNAAGVFTQNRFTAAPVIISKANIQAHGNNGIGSVVVNSGCANACTGEQGLENARLMGELASQHSPVKGLSSLVMSTGVIGQHLPMDKVAAGIKKAAGELSESFEGWTQASKAIMTTDTVHKMLTRSVELPGVKEEITLTGITKGVGMIHPNMATMLCVMATDANIHPSLLNQAVKYSADRSFNCISVDGDTSTNDSFVILANGASGSKQITDPSDPAFQALMKEVTTTAQKLAQLQIRDGEGATKFVTITIESAKNSQQARLAATAIATSALVKTAIFGRDANWGRIVCALGYSGAEFDPKNVQLHMSTSKDGKVIDSLHLFKDGAPYEIDEPRAAHILEHVDIDFKLQLGENPNTEPLTYWTHDLSYDYVKINADYRT